MTKVLNLLSNFYQTPTDTVLQHRNAFYSIQKETTETVANWFCRIRRATEYCDFGDLGDFLVIDKFFCGLDDDAKQLLRQTNTWSAAELYRAVNDPKFLIETNVLGETAELGIVEFLKIELKDVVSSSSSSSCSNDTSIETQLLIFILCLIPRKVLHHFSTAVPITVRKIIWVTFTKIDRWPISWNVMRKKRMVHEKSNRKKKF